MESLVIIVTVILWTRIASLIGPFVSVSLKVPPEKNMAHVRPVTNVAC